ncbi:MAG: hypothetical protein M5R41_14695 [Bacteroidia bacterium]|nr:hypothetical protein [Bacteroidia bacterium]
MTDLERDRFRILMMKALDGELAGSEHSEFESFLRDPSCMQEWQKFSTIQEATMSLRMKVPPTEQWDSYWSGTYNRLERGVAWLLTAVGSVLLLSWVLFEAASALWIDADVPFLIKVAIVVFNAGILLLLVSVMRERWFTSKTDKYKGVIR